QFLDRIAGLWRPGLAPGDFTQIDLFGTFDQRFFPMLSPLRCRLRPSYVNQAKSPCRIRTEDRKTQFFGTRQDERKLLAATACEIAYAIKGRRLARYAEVCISVLTS